MTTSKTNKKTQLIVITGMDGAGKSTAIEMVLSSLKNKNINALSCSIWDNLSLTPLKTKEDMQSYLKVLNPKSRLLFLSHAMLNAIEAQLKNKPDVLIVDSFIYKYLANEMARDINPDFINKTLALFPQPDKVFFLKLEPEKAYNRKSNLSDYESNGDFIEFQKKMIPYWEQLKQKHWVELDAKLPPETIAESMIWDIV